MSELPRLVNLLIEFGEKLEGSVNKKYRAFIRSMLSMEALMKSINPKKVCIGKELIVFKLGLEAKSTKAIELSLSYLHKLFMHKFIDSNQPNYCENFVIEQSNIREVAIAEVHREMRHELVRLIEPLIHFKSYDISVLMLRVLEYLISEPILQLLLELCCICSHEMAQVTLFNFFSFRFHVFQDIYTYKQSELELFGVLVLRNERVDKQMVTAWKKHQQLAQLITCYMNEYLAIIEGVGGRYGFCVMCSLPADHYCKITKASLCSIECKKQHLEIAEKQYKDHFQARNLWVAIEDSFKVFLTFLEKRECVIALTVLMNLLDKPHLFMVVKPEFKQLIKKFIGGVLQKASNYKAEQSFDLIYFLVASLTRHWMLQTVNCIENFFTDSLLKVLEDKKPNTRLLSLVFKTISKIFEHGQTTVQLYVNFDCEVNRNNLVEKCMFQIARICQDRLNGASNLSKADKCLLKDWCVSVYMVMSEGLNAYRRRYPSQLKIDSILWLKQRKTSLQKFTIKFNEHWSNGLKTLFNLNLVGLDSDQEIVDILGNLKGISKKNIDELLFCENGEQYRTIVFRNLTSSSILSGLIHLHHLVPLQSNSVAVKHYIEAWKAKRLTNAGNQAEQNGQEISKDIANNVNKWVTFLSRQFSLQQFRQQMREQGNYSEKAILNMYTLAQQIRSAVTIGCNQTFFTYCLSRSYLQLLSSQISLLQIPLAYLLQTDYNVLRLLSLTGQLVQICMHSNWISLLIKNCAIEEFPGTAFDQAKLRIAEGIFELVENTGSCIQEWSTILHFITQIYNLLLKIESKIVVQTKVSLSYKITYRKIENCLLAVGAEAKDNFSKYVLGLMFVSKEELARQNKFMLQKLFEVINGNFDKFLNNFEVIFSQLLRFSEQVVLGSGENCMYLADMLKQCIAKINKAMSNEGRELSQNVQASLLRLFIVLAQHNSKEVVDFVVNCVSMTIMNHYQMKPQGWDVVINIMLSKGGLYRSQVRTILEKIIDQNLRLCESYHRELVEVCLLLLTPQDVKCSTEALHLLQALFKQIIIDTLSHQTEQETVTTIRQLLLPSLRALKQSLKLPCHERVMEMMFLLLRQKVNDIFLLTMEDVNKFIKDVFEWLHSFPKQQLVVAEKVINYSLDWSVKISNMGIIENLETLIIDRYDALSFTAMRCIKTLIQMINPKDRNQWKPIENILLHVLEDTHLSNSIDLTVQGDYNELCIEDSKRVNIFKKKISTAQLANRMVTQKFAIELLPNDLQCLKELRTIYEETIAFNNNLYLRCLLWQQRLSTRASATPPQFLSLEEVISNRILAIYGMSHQLEVYPFGIAIFRRFNETAEYLRILKMQQGQEKEEIHFEVNYLERRQGPLFKIMNYLLPKVQKICTTDAQRKELILQILKATKFVQSRQPFFKAIHELGFPACLNAQLATES